MEWNEEDGITELSLEMNSTEPVKRGACVLERGRSQCLDSIVGGTDAFKEQNSEGQRGSKEKMGHRSL